MMNQWASITRI